MPFDFDFKNMDYVSQLFFTENKDLLDRAFWLRWYAQRNLMIAKEDDRSDDIKTYSLIVEHADAIYSELAKAIFEYQDKATMEAKHYK